MATTIEAEDEFDLARLPRVRAPTLLVGGGRDRFYDRELFEQTAELIPRCVLKLYPRRGHVTVVSDRRAVGRSVRLSRSPPRLVLESAGGSDLGEPAAAQLDRKAGVGCT
jgi:pimeloyl-ACP methyl ester carboxylesterase